MKRVTRSRINAIHNAGTCIDTFDMESGLSQKELDDHQELGQLLIEHAEDVIRLLFKLQSEKPS